jgi:acyl dehydratase
MGVNYGLNKVRFPAPCPWAAAARPHQAAGGRAGAARRHADDLGVTVEREGSDKPVCVAESLSRSHGAAQG